MKSVTVVSIAAALTAVVFSVAVDAASKGGKHPKAKPVEVAEETAVSVGSGEGKVLEVLSGGEYTYLNVKLAGGPTWVACPKTTVKKGATVIVPAGMEMRDFESKTLKRTFPLIYFVGGVEVKGSKESKGKAQAAPVMAPVEEKPAEKVTGIQKTAGGKTVGEIFGGKKELGGQEIVVRGKVVKRNLGIMKKTWLHIQDGTGEKGLDDLVVTTLAEPEVGDVVLVKGKVSLDKDFGFGYRYDLLIEDAAVTKE